jgi:hypothetical protein
MEDKIKNNISIKDLRKDTLYIAHIVHLKDAPIFSKIIAFFNKLNGEKDYKITHSAVILYDDLAEKFKLCGTTYFGAGNTNLVVNDNDIIFISEAFKINLSIKSYILEELCFRKAPIGFIKTAVLTSCVILGYPYPLVAALASFKFKRFGKFGDLLGKVLDILKRIQSRVVKMFFFIKRPSFCSELVVRIIKSQYKKIASKQKQDISGYIQTINDIEDPSEIQPIDLFQICDANKLI